MQRTIKAARQATFAGGAVAATRLAIRRVEKILQSMLAFATYGTDIQRSLINLLYIDIMEKRSLQSCADSRPSISTRTLGM